MLLSSPDQAVEEVRPTPPFRASAAHMASFHWLEASPVCAAMAHIAYSTRKPLGNLTSFFTSNHLSETPFLVLLQY
jgi:hypothetical protein